MNIFYSPFVSQRKHIGLLNILLAQSFYKESIKLSRNRGRIFNLTNLFVLFLQNLLIIHQFRAKSGNENIQLQAVYNPRLFIMAASTCCMMSAESVASLGGRSRFLSTVRIWDRFTIESFDNPSCFRMGTQMG